MNDLKPYEFIGGPLDGDVRELPGAKWFRVETHHNSLVTVARYRLEDGVYRLDQGPAADKGGR